MSTEKRDRDKALEEGLEKEARIYPFDERTRAQVLIGYRHGFEDAAKAHAKETEPLLRMALNALSPDIDCGDNSCRFAKVRGGMRTNGGCRCFQKYPREVARNILHAQHMIKAHLGEGGEKWVT